MDDIRYWQLLFLFGQILGTLPWWLVLFVGSFVCLRQLTFRPHESWLMIGAIALSLFDTFGVPNAVSLLFQFIPGFMDSVVTGANSGWTYRLMYGLPSSLIQAAAWSLILYAAFGEGSEPRSKYLVEEERIEEEAV